MEENRCSEKGVMLTDENYFAWSVKSKAFLMHKGCWDAVDPGFSTEDSEAGFDSAQRKKNHSALAHILLSVSDRYIDYIGECATAKKAWTVLQNMHEKFDVYNQIEFLEELTTIRKGDDMTMREYVAKVKDLCRKVRKAGVTFNDHTLAIFLLRGLPRDRYEIFVRSITTNNAVLTMEEVVSKMETEEKRLNREDRCDDIHPKALKGLRREPPKGTFWPKKRDSSRAESQICFTCKQPGHISKCCPRVLEAKGKGTVVCFVCREIGHIASYCPQVQKKGANCSKTNPKIREARASVEEKEDGEIELAKTSLVKVKALMVTDRGNERKVMKWFVDSGASEHMTPHREILTNFDSNTKGIVDVANGHELKICGKGSAELKLSDENGGWCVKLERVLYVPDLQDNLMSLRQFDKKGCKAVVEKGCLNVMHDGDIFLKSIANGGMYEVQCLWYGTNDVSEGNAKEELVAAKSRVAVCRETWHKRFGHSKSLPDAAIIPKGKDEKCDVCAVGKMKRRPFCKRDGMSEHPLDLVYSDVCYVDPESIGGGRYFITFTDDFSRYSVVNIIKSKFEVLGCFQRFKDFAEKQLNCKLKAFQSDNGGEYIGKQFELFLEREGIKRRLTQPYSPQQNGVSERLNQQLLSLARCMLIGSGLPMKFWAEAISTACFIKNRCTSKAVGGKVPYELWTGRKLPIDDLQRMRIFGCKAFVHCRSKNKLYPRAKLGVFLGYSSNSKTYRVWVMEDQCVIESRDVEFEENIFPMLSKTCEWSEGKVRKQSGNDQFVGRCMNSGEEAEIIENWFQLDIDSSLGESDSQASEEMSEVESIAEVELPQPMLNLGENQLFVPRRSDRIPKATRPCSHCRAANSHTFDIPEIHDPLDYEKAMSGENKSKWLEAMSEEMENLACNNVWELVDRPVGQKVIGTKWVLKVKRDANGKVERYKARLVAQGYHQEYGTDYFESHCPVVRRKLVRLLIALGVENEWYSKHMDVRCAFLNSDIKEMVYVEQPKGFVNIERADNVYKLNKSMYGLHQSARNWYKFLDDKLKSCGMLRSVNDACLYYHCEKDLYLVVYVDDLGIWGTKIKVEWLAKKLSKMLDIRDLGKVCNFLSLRVTYCDRKNVYLDQETYAKSVLEHFGMADAKGLKTPLVVNDCDKLSLPNEKKIQIDPTTYRKGIGSLLYLGNSTRPDIMFSVCKLSQHNSNPANENWCDVKHLFRYLKYTERLALHYSQENKPIEVYVDADWANNRIDRRSFSGYVVILAGGAVSWKTSKQGRVALSTVEAESMAMIEATKEVIWLTSLLVEIGQDRFLPKPCRIFADNNGAISQTKREMVSERTKHVHKDCMFLKDVVEQGDVEFIYCPSKDNLADILTKVLTGPRIKEVIPKLGLRELPSN